MSLMFMSDKWMNNYNSICLHSCNSTIKCYSSRFSNPLSCVDKWVILRGICCLYASFRFWKSITVRKSRWLLGLPWHCLHFLSSSVENEFDWSIGNSEGRVRRTNFTTVVCYFHVKFLQNLKNIHILQQ